MIFAITILVILYFLYILFIKGLLWKLIISIFGWLGMYWFLINVDELATSGITIAGCLVSWAAVIPSIIVALAMMYSKED